jgi:FlaA1/EpsC-like NDP-sugar epimerase
MDQPLFGERTTKTSLLFYIVSALITIFVLFSVVIAVVFGISTHEHFVLALSLICSYITLVVMYKWYSNGELDPKFKYLLAFYLLTVILIAISMNCYVWIKRTEIETEKIKCNGVYRTSDGACFVGVNGCQGSSSICVQFNGTQAACVTIPDCNPTTTSTTGVPFF